MRFTTEQLDSTANNISLLLGKAGSTLFERLGIFGFELKRIQALEARHDTWFSQGGERPRPTATVHPITLPLSVDEAMLGCCRMSCSFNTTVRHVHADLGPRHAISKSGRLREYIIDAALVPPPFTGITERDLQAHRYQMVAGP